MADTNQNPKINGDGVYSGDHDHGQWDGRNQIH